VGGASSGYGKDVRLPSRGTLAAFTNALVLVFLSLWLGYERSNDLRAPVQVVESWMIWTSLAALCVNGGITLALVRGRNDLNLRSILIHNFGDALSNIAIIAGRLPLELRVRSGSTLFSVSRLVCWCCGPASEFCGNPHTFCWRGAARNARGRSGARDSHYRGRAGSSRRAHLVAGGGHNALSLHARVRTCTWMNASAS